MKSQKVSAICFDMWGTLCEGGGGREWKVLQKNLGASHIDKKKFYILGLDSLLLHPWTLRKGILHLAKRLELKINNEIVEKAYQSFWQIVEKSKPYIETVPVLKKLKQKKIRTIIISNTDSESFYFELKKFNLKKYFEQFFISSEIGSLKHHGEMFNHAQNYLAIPKTQILMVDDSLEHGVIPARQFGWKALWLTRNQQAK